MDLLLNPEKWMETPVATVAAAMTERGVMKIQLSAANGDRAIFAMVLISGKNTQALLDAMAAKEDELHGASPPSPDDSDAMARQMRDKYMVQAADQSGGVG